MLKIARFNVSAPLAQLVEQLTLNQWVRGSSPRRCICFQETENALVKTKGMNQCF